MSSKIILKNDNENLKVKKKISNTNLNEIDCHLIIEFNRKKEFNDEIIESIQNKLENEKFKIIKHDYRLYLFGDELSILFEAELNGLIKFNSKENRWKKFKLEDYIDLNEIDNQSDKISKILTRNEKIRICQLMIEENIQVSKRIIIPLLGNCYPAQSFIQICLNNNIIKNIYAFHDADIQNLINKLSNYLITFCLNRLQLNDIRNYFNEQIAIVFLFIDKLIKFQTFSIICYLILIIICNFNFDNSFIAVLSTLIVNLTSLLWIKYWKYTFNELNSDWLLNRNIKQLKLDYKSRSLYCNHLIPIKQLIPKPDESIKQYRRKKNTWILIGFVLFSLLFYQIIFFNFYSNNQSNQTIAFNYLIIHFIFLNLIKNLLTRFLIYRNNREEYFTIEKYQESLFIKILVLNLFIYNSLPLIIILFDINSSSISLVLQSQILIKLIIDLIFNFLLPILNYYWHTIRINLNDGYKFVESKFVLKESSKDKFDDLIYEWFFILQQFIYLILYCSIYPNIILIIYINLLIHNLIYFIKLCYLFKRPLYYYNCYAHLITKFLDPIFIFSSILNLFNLDLYTEQIFTEQINFQITAQQFNLIIILIIFLSTFLMYLLPDQSYKSNNRQNYQDLEYLIHFRLLNEKALNQTIDNIYKKNN